MANTRKEYKKYVSFHSGYAVISITRPRSPLDLTPVEFLTLMPLEAVLGYFSNPTAVADRIEKIAGEVVRRWMRKNEFAPEGQRTTVNWCEDIWSMQWRNAKGHLETTVYQLRLNTYQFNMNNQFSTCPKMNIEDVKVVFSVKFPANIV